MKPTSWKWVFLCTVTIATAHADVVLAPLFRDHCVLQRDKVVPIWGRADPGEKVAVTFGDQTAATEADAAGRWRVKLNPLTASASGAAMVVQGRNTLTVHDIVVGEVWLCSGQSNMNRSVKLSRNAEAEIAAANYPLIRQIKFPRRVSPVPRDDAEGAWQVASPATVGEFTAVGYFFARDAFRELGIPIGLVHSSYGGTPVEAWMPAETLAGEPAFAVVLERWERVLAEFPGKKAKFDAVLAQWKTDEAAARQRGTQDGEIFCQQNPEPKPPYPGPGSSWAPSVLYNSMVHPIIPYALRGVLWYQGESNAGRHAEYRRLFTAMIAVWRERFGQGDLPFYWVQLANFKAGDANGRDWAFLREAQTQALAASATGMASAIDIGEIDDIHPKNKQDVGHRLWLVARAQTHQRVGEYSGPQFDRVDPEGGRLRVHFTHATGGLVARGESVQSLELAGEDRVFLPATGLIERDTLIVSSPQVAAPVAVRYAWRNAPVANLYNGADLPAVPFRSDDWRTQAD